MLLGDGVQYLKWMESTAMAVQSVFSEKIADIFAIFPLVIKTNPAASAF